MNRSTTCYVCKIEGKLDLSRENDTMLNILWNLLEMRVQQIFQSGRGFRTGSFVAGVVIRSGVGIREPHSGRRLEKENIGHCRTFNFTESGNAFHSRI